MGVSWWGLWRPGWNIWILIGSTIGPWAKESQMMTEIWESQFLLGSHVVGWEEGLGVRRLFLAWVDKGLDQAIGTSNLGMSASLYNCMHCSTPGFLVLQYLLEFAQTHVHWVSDVIQPSHPLSPSSPPALNLSQHQGLFLWAGSSHQVAKVLKFQLQQQSFQWIFKVNFL